MEALKAISPTTPEDLQRLGIGTPDDPFRIHVTAAMAQVSETTTEEVSRQLMKTETGLS